MPHPRGLGFVLQAKGDADHAADTVTRISRTGFLVHLNCATVYFFSNNHTSVESSRFGSELVLKKQHCEYLQGICYKLRMMGIPCEGPAYISGDNQSVLANTTIPDSTLNNNSHIIAYHSIHEVSHGMSGLHHMSILKTMMQISSPSYFPLVKIEKVLSETFYTMSFRRTQRRRLSHGLWNNTMMLHTTPKSNSGCRTIRTTICWSSSCGRATFLFILCFYILKIVMLT